MKTPAIVSDDLPVAPSPARNRLRRAFKQLALFKRELALSILSGLLLATGLPTLNFWPMGFVALIPFLWSLRRTRGVAAFALGMVFGLAYMYASIFWLNAIWPFAPSPPFAILGVFLLAVYCALYYGIFGWFSRKFERLSPVATALSLAAVWTLLEWIRSVGQLAFPWAYLAHTQSANLPFIQMADIGGTFIISFVLLAINYLLLHLLFIRNCRSYAPSIALLALISAPYAYGAWRMQDPWTDGKAIRVGISQPNIEQIDKLLSYAHPDESQRAPMQAQIQAVQFAQVRAIRQAAPDTQLYILPETAFTQPDFQVNRSLQSSIAALAREVNGAIFFGADNAETDSDRDRERIYVSAWMADPVQGIIAKAYNKMRLVPFGESLPYFEYIPYFQDKVLGMGTFDRGREYVLFDLGNTRFGCGICFESAAPRQMAKIVQAGAQFLAIITNDAWYLHRLWQIDPRGAPQHDALSTFRAVECRRWIARSANTGISRLIDPAGRAIVSAPRDERTFVTGTLYARDGKTFYTAWGDWLAILFLIIAAVGWRTGNVARASRP